MRKARQSQKQAKVNSKAATHRRVGVKIVEGVFIEVKTFQESKISFVLVLSGW